MNNFPLPSDLKRLGGIFMLFLTRLFEFRQTGKAGATGSVNNHISTLLFIYFSFFVLCTSKNTIIFDNIFLFFSSNSVKYTIDGRFYFSFCLFLGGGVFVFA
jgi:hypothetical protein